MRGRPHLIPALVVAVMLVVAIASLPYGYYQLLRWVTCGVAVFIAIMAYRWGKVWATGIFGLVAVLFNPLLPIYLTREIWRPIDLTCAVLFIVSIFILKEHKAHIV
jgi:FtsH-binding integral membrane protein